MATKTTKNIELTRDEQIILLNALDTLEAHTVSEFIYQYELRKKLEALYGARCN